MGHFSFKLCLIDFRQTSDTAMFSFKSDETTHITVDKYHTGAPAHSVWLAAFFFFSTDKDRVVVGSGGRTGVARSADTPFSH